MRNLVLTTLSRLHKEEAGQGLVEYLLILALVAFAATAGRSPRSAKSSASTSPSDVPARMFVIRNILNPRRLPPAAAFQKKQTC
jgi:Flp pilus assembly pilin Flp